MRCHRQNTKILRNWKVKNVGYHQLVYWKPNIKVSYTLTSSCTNLSTFILYLWYRISCPPNYIQMTWWRWKWPKGKKEQNEKALILGKAEIMCLFQSVKVKKVKGLSPKETKGYEEGKEHTEWLYTSFIPDDQINFTIFHALQEHHLNVTSFIGKWGSDILSDLLNNTS